MSLLCPNCSSHVPSGSAFCESCGVAQPLQPDQPNGTGSPPGDVGAPTGAPISPGGSAAVDATRDGTYGGLRLQFDEAPRNLDPLTNRDYILAVVRKALVFTVIWWIGWFVPALVYLVGARTFAAALLVIWCVALAALFWFMPEPVLLSDWKLTVDGSAGAATAVLDHMAWTIHERRTPLDSLRAKQLSVPGQPPRVYLELRHGLFAGYVSSFAYGNDLFVGWTFWLYMSPARWVLLALGRAFQALTLRGSALYVALRYDPAKALRETLHSTLRQGVDVASGRVRPAGGGSIGSALPIEAAPVKAH